ncbi:MAG TPA: MerR family transcriptional regulator [Puia sp.]|nr:MerR family transcriptional regulator [Puia sp.]
MSNRLTQIALDFGPEHMAPAPPSGAETGSASQPPIRQYIEAAGVVVRFKSYKNTHKPQPDKDAAPDKNISPDNNTAPDKNAAPDNNSAPDNNAIAEKTAAPPVVKLPAAEPENQLQIFDNRSLFAAEPTAAAATEPESTISAPIPSTNPVPEPEPAIIASTSSAASAPPAEPAPIVEPAPAVETETITSSISSATSTAPTEPQPGADPQPIATSQPTRTPQPGTDPQSAIEPSPSSRPDQRRAARPKPAAPKAPSKRGRKSLKQVTAEADLIEVPTDEVLFSKQYYTMGEVSEMFRVNQSLLRFWETEFDILQPRKNKKGDRYFRPVDIKNLHLIYHLLRQKKYTIEGAKEFLKKNKKADERFEVIQRLQEIRTFLLEWKAQL